MTVQLESPPLWRTRPGWGIRVDLTPPEVVEERRVARLQRRLGTGLLVVLVLTALVYVLAVRHHGSAESELEDEQLTGTQLRARAADYSDITQMQKDLTLRQQQISTLMSGDVAIDTLSEQLSAGLPAGTTITSESISFSGAGAAAASSGSSTSSSTGTSTAGTDAASEIGSVSLSGKGRTLDDVAAYVEKLQVIKGVTNVVPLSNASSSGERGVVWSVTLSLTSDLLTHRYDLAGTAQ